MSLSHVNTPDLEDLLRGLNSGRLRCPLTATQLAFAGFGARAKHFHSLAEKNEAIVRAVLTHVLAERHAHHAALLELVWTGPDTENAESRDSEQILRELFGTAMRSVLLVGYSFDRRGGVLRELHTAMRDRGVSAQIFFDISQIRHREHYLQQPLAAFVQDAAQYFLREHWGFGPPLPDLYVDARMLQDENWGTGGFPKLSLHAKCAVVDGQQALVTSANFTERGQRRNVELGVRIVEAGFAKQLERQFHQLVEIGAMVRVGQPLR